MTRSKNPRGSVSCALRGTSLTALCVLICAALFLGGCKKNDNTGNSGSMTGTDTGNTLPANIDTSSAEVIKGMANEQGKATQPDRGNFSVEYSAVRNPEFAQINEQFRQQRMLESIADDLNASIAIPENVVITFKECGQPNAFWNPRDKQIVMCYELMAQMSQDFSEVAKTREQLGEMVGGALTFAFIHELGHCLIDVLKLPSTGREEDAVDQLSTFVLVSLKGEEGERMAISGALSWGIQYERLAKSGKTAAELDMLWADEHSMDGQRFYNILCWVFGHNPNKYMGMVNNPLPEARAVRCPGEYSRLANAWLSLLKPYLKDGGAKASAHTEPMDMPGSTQGAPPSQPSSTPGGGGHSGH
jgi:Putative metallopeptidase